MKNVKTPRPPFTSKGVVVGRKVYHPNDVCKLCNGEKWVDEPTITKPCPACHGTGLTEAAYSRQNQ